MRFEDQQKANWHGDFATLCAIAPQLQRVGERSSNLHMQIVGEYPALRERLAAKAVLFPVAAIARPVPALA